MFGKCLSGYAGLPEVPPNAYSGEGTSADSVGSVRRFRQIVVRPCGAQTKGRPRAHISEDLYRHLGDRNLNCRTLRR